MIPRDGRHIRRPRRSPIDTVLGGQSVTGQLPGGESGLQMRAPGQITSPVTDPMSAENQRLRKEAMGGTQQLQQQQATPLDAALSTEEENSWVNPFNRLTVSDIKVKPCDFIFDSINVRLPVCYIFLNCLSYFFCGNRFKLNIKGTPETMLAHTCTNST